MEWHLDGWDAAAGRAFASLRPRNKELFDHEKSWGPTVYVGPPSFRPEPIASSAIALASSRAASFQPRTPPEAGAPELGFPSAEAVADFVRRTFVNGGSTGGGGDAPPVTEQAPRVPPLGGEGNPIPNNHYLEAWNEAQNRLAQEDPERSALPVAFGPAVEWPTVESGALQLIATMLTAFPGVDDPARFERWYRPALSLYRAVQELGFWSRWKRGTPPVDLGGDWRLDSIVAGILKGVPETHDLGQLNAPLFVGWLLSCYPSYLPGTKDASIKYLLDLRIGASTGDLTRIVNEGPAPRDLYESMFDWTLPAYVRELELQSAGQLLMAFVSAPGSFLDSSARIYDVVAFCAALLSSGVQDRREEFWRERAAAGWLAASMPKWIFRSEAENLIRQFSHRRVPALA